MTADLASLKATVHGRVTGIGFRAFVQVKAKTLGLTGYVRNTPAGRSVELEAEGEKDKLEKLVDYLKTGPPLAKVEQVDVQWLDYAGRYADFRVRW